MKITKNQLITALLKAEQIQPQDRIHQVTVNPSNIEISYEAVELATGFSAPHTLKVHEDDIIPWDIDVIKDGAKRIII
jgi:hypothetical protein